MVLACLFAACQMSMKEAFCEDKIALLPKSEWTPAVTEILVTHGSGVVQRLVIEVNIGAGSSTHNTQHVPQK